MTPAGEGRLVGRIRSQKRLIVDFGISSIGVRIVTSWPADLVTCDETEVTEEIEAMHSPDEVM
jgi:hypothetical protein